MKKSALVLLIGLVFGTASIPAMSQSGYEVSQIMRNAEKGDAVAQATLGQLYENGIVRGKDANAEARKWYEMAAAQGNRLAEIYLAALDAKIARSRQAVSTPPRPTAAPQVAPTAPTTPPRNSAVAPQVAATPRVAPAPPSAPREAAPAPQQQTPGVQTAREVELLRRAAQGDVEAQSSLGAFYEFGELSLFGARTPVVQNFIEAEKWNRLAAEQGDSNAQDRLGSFYARGYVVAEDENEAAKWYRLAAEQGNTSAQSSLGAIYNSRQDYVHAYIWFAQAAEHDDISLALFRHVRTRMSPAQIADAQRLASTCQASNYKNCD